MGDITWAAKMALGALCYWPVLWLPLGSPLSNLLLPWAGFYAHDNCWRVEDS